MTNGIFITHLVYWSTSSRHRRGDLTLASQVCEVAEILFLDPLNPLSPNSDQHKISSNIIYTFSRDKVMRINKTISKEKMPWSFIKFSQLILTGNVRRSLWRICTCTLGLKGLTDSIYNDTELCVSDFPSNNNIIRARNLLLASNLRNKVARCKFLVPSLCNVIMMQLVIWHDPSDLIVWNIVNRSQCKFGGKLALCIRFGTFSLMKAKQDRMKCLF